MDLSTIASFLRMSDSGIWYAEGQEAISYPSEGNDACFEVEDRSFWFQHRNVCIVEMVQNFPPVKPGPFFDIGGGNGCVAKGLIDAGWAVVVVEPGQRGAENSRKRGVSHVVCATTRSAGFNSETMPAIGVFDVVEHIEDDLSFLRHLWDLLSCEGMLYLTVPAFQELWSQEDVDAGHFRRYSIKQMENRLIQAGFNIVYSTYIFKWIVVPIGIFRALPYRCGFNYKQKKDPHKIQRDHVLKRGLFSNALQSFLKLESLAISEKRTLPFGASCMIAASKSH